MDHTNHPTFSEQEVNPTPPREVLLVEGFWRRYFGNGIDNISVIDLTAITLDYMLMIEEGIVICGYGLQSIDVLNTNTIIIDTKDRTEWTPEPVVPQQMPAVLEGAMIAHPPNHYNTPMIDYILSNTDELNSFEKRICDYGDKMNLIDFAGSKAFLGGKIRLGPTEIELEKPIKCESLYRSTSHLARPWWQKPHHKTTPLMGRKCGRFNTYFFISHILNNITKNFTMKMKFTGLNTTYNPFLRFGIIRLPLSDAGGTREDFWRYCDGLQASLNNIVMKRFESIQPPHIFVSLLEESLPFDFTALMTYYGGVEVSTLSTTDCYDDIHIEQNGVAGMVVEKQERQFVVNYLLDNNKFDPFPGVLVRDKRNEIVVPYVTIESAMKDNGSINSSIKLEISFE